MPVCKRCLIWYDGITDRRCPYCDRDNLSIYELEKIKGWRDETGMWKLDRYYK